MPAPRAASAKALRASSGLLSPRNTSRQACRASRCCWVPALGQWFVSISNACRALDMLRTSCVKPTETGTGLSNHPKIWSVSMATPPDLLRISQRMTAREVACASRHSRPSRVPACTAILWVRTGPAGSVQGTDFERRDGRRAVSWSAQAVSFSRSPATGVGDLMAVFEVPVSGALRPVLRPSGQAPIPSNQASCPRRTGPRFRGRLPMSACEAKTGRDRPRMSSTWPARRAPRGRWLRMADPGGPARPSDFEVSAGPVPCNR